MKYAFLAGLVLIAGCAKPAEEATREPEAPSEASSDVRLSAEALKTAGVEFAEVRAYPMQSMLTVTGTVQTTGAGRATVTPPVSGKIVRILAKAGDRVEKGQPLAILQSYDLAQAGGLVTEAANAVQTADAAVRHALAEVDLARAQARTAQTDLQRQRALAKAGAFAQAPLQSAQRELSDAQADLATAKNLAAAKDAAFARAERLLKEGLVSRVDYDQAKLEVTQSKLSVERASARVDLATQAYARESRVSQAGLLNAREVQSAEAAARQARLEVERANIDVQTAQAAAAAARRTLGVTQQNLRTLGGGKDGQLRLLAPISGIVTTQEATLGQAVERSTDLFDIENLSAVYVIANVPETAVGGLRQGAACTINVPALPGQTFTGTVQVVGTKLDPKSRTMPVSCLVQNPAGVLRAEMSATVAIGSGAKSSAVAVPESAIDRDGEDAFVFVRKGDAFEKRPVTLGRKQNGRTEILKGLRPGERIAVKGLFVLTSESKRDELKGEED